MIQKLTEMEIDYMIIEGTFKIKLKPKKKTNPHKN